MTDTAQTNRVIVQPSIRDVDGIPYAIEEFPDATLLINDDGSATIKGPTRTGHFPAGQYAFATREIVRGPNEQENLLREAAVQMRELARTPRNHGFGAADECLRIADDIDSLLGV